MSDNLVILASYPKTGSTWLRKIISETVCPDGSPDVVVPSFYKQFPDVPEYTMGEQKLGFVKTHLHPQHPNFGMVTGRIKFIVTIYRNPIDVLLSSLNYARVKDRRSVFIGNIPKPVEQIIADGEILHYADEFVKNDGFSWHSPQSGSFSLYQRRWRSMAEHYPYLEIRYEDMVAKPEETLGELFKRLLGEHDQEMIDLILQRADTRTKIDGEFYWRRQAYGYKALLPQDQYEEIGRRFRGMLDELAYGV